MFSPAWLGADVRRIFLSICLALRVPAIGVVWDASVAQVCLALHADAMIGSEPMIRTGLQCCMAKCDICPPPSLK